MAMLLLVSFVTLVILGVPIAFVLGTSAFVSLWFGSTQALTIIPQQMFAACDSFPLLAIPLFMIAGSLMGEGGISKLAPGTKAAYDYIRERTQPIEEDIIMIDELDKFDKIVKSGEIIEAVEKVVPLK